MTGEAQRFLFSRPGRAHGALVAAALMACGGVVGAQGRVLETHQFDEPEGRLLAFYSASMAFTTAGLRAPAGFSVGMEIALVPYLNEAQRRPSIDKPEATNLSPVFPRPRIGARVGAFFLEGSWIPPIRVFDIEANVVSGSVSFPAWRVRGIDLTPRVWAMTGRVRGAITCAASAMLGKGSALETYYNTVCHGRESDDWFEPRVVAGEVVASGPIGTSQVRWSAGAGVRVDRTRFDIGVLKPDGSRDQDHPVLELEATRPHLTLGADWAPRPSLASGVELLYAPGSVATVRASVRWSVQP